MKKINLIWLGLSFSFIFFCNPIFSQDSSRLRISLITCSPGEELYSIFGHSAIRVIDSNSVTDYVYNFGTFNFDDDFYINFTKGKLLYYVSVSRVDDFMYEYIETHRGVYEQELALTESEKKSIQHSLNENIKEENKYYKYDFFYDNCTTRLRDLILKYKNTTPALPFVMDPKTTFRKALHFYLEKGNQYWSELGIDLLLGAPIDKIMTATEQEFLPDNLMYAIKKCNNTILIKNEKTLYEPSNSIKQHSLNQPLIFFTVLLIMVVWLSFVKNNIAFKLLTAFDRTLFGFTGFLGLLLIGMWLFTDHQTMKDNFNLLWANPLNLINVFIITNKNRIVKRYFLFSALLLGVLLCCWWILPQQFNIALFPFVLLLLYRSYCAYKR